MQFLHFSLTLQVLKPFQWYKNTSTIIQGFEDYRNEDDNFDKFEP